MITPWERARLHSQPAGSRERLLVLAALAAVFVVFVLVVSAVGAGAAPVFKVDDKTDAVDATPGDGKCETSDNSCTLRAAVMEAGAAGGEITLPAGTFKLTIPGGTEVGEQFLANQPDAAKGDLDISKRIQISGEGPGETVIDGLGKVRIFDVHAPDGNLLLSEVRLTRGIGDFDKASGHYHGGAIHNHAYANLAHVVVDDSLSPPPGSLECSQQFSPAACAPWGGGGITNASNGVAGLSNVTVARNKTDYHGGGIENYGRLTVFRTTVAENTAPAEKGGGIWTGGTTSSVTPDHTLVAQNTGGDCWREGGTVSENTHSLQGDGTCGFGGPTDQTTSPKFEPGLPGAPLYYALSSTSVAVDGGADTCQDRDDVRGVSRPQDGNNDGKALCDIGSYERAGPGQPTISITNAKVTEVAPAVATAAAAQRPRIGILSFAVRLSKPSKKVVTVRAGTADRTARAGADYVKRFAKLRFKPGQLKKSFLVPVLADRRAEGAETLKVRLTDATHAKLGRAFAIGTILGR
jgi:Calx-beta domain